MHCVCCNMQGICLATSVHTFSSAGHQIYLDPASKLAENNKNIKKNCKILEDAGSYSICRDSVGQCAVCRCHSSTFHVGWIVQSNDHVRNIYYHGRGEGTVQFFGKAKYNNIRCCILVAVVGPLTGPWWIAVVTYCILLSKYTTVCSALSTPFNQAGYQFPLPHNTLHSLSLSLAQHVLQVEAEGRGTRHYKSQIPTT